MDVQKTVSIIQMKKKIRQAMLSGDYDKADQLQAKLSRLQSSGVRESKEISENFDEVVDHYISESIKKEFSE